MAFLFYGTNRRSGICKLVSSSYLRYINKPYWLTRSSSLLSVSVHLSNVESELMKFFFVVLLPLTCPVTPHCSSSWGCLLRSARTSVCVKVCLCLIFVLIKQERSAAPARPVVRAAEPSCPATSSLWGRTVYFRIRVRMNIQIWSERRWTSIWVGMLLIEMLVFIQQLRGDRYDALIFGAHLTDASRAAATLRHWLLEFNEAHFFQEKWLFIITIDFLHIIRFSISTSCPVFVEQELHTGSLRDFFSISMLFEQYFAGSFWSHPSSYGDTNHLKGPERLFAPQTGDLAPLLT